MPPRLTVRVLSETREVGIMINDASCSLSFYLDLEKGGQLLQELESALKILEQGQEHPALTQEQLPF